MRTLLRGLVAGALATLPMSFFMEGAQQLGLLGKAPPRKITERMLGMLGIHRPPPPAEDVATAALHLGFGAGGGALFAVIHRRAGSRLPAWLAGTVYATGVWAVSYYGWVPGLGVMPPPGRDRPGRGGSMLAAHWVYGAVLGLLLAFPSHRRNTVRRRAKGVSASAISN